MKDKTTNGKFLPLIEKFYSIQGEGYHTGEAAYFVRLGGCDIGCKWCDTKFSWQSDNQLTKTDEIIEDIVKTSAKALVVTGGEPLIYNLDYLCFLARKNNIKTFLETAGNHPLTGQWDWICLSPKIINPAYDNIFHMADELKVIIDENLDFKWAIENAKKVKSGCKLFLQPEWSKYETIIHEIVTFVKENPIWKISLQSHKFMHIP